MEKNIKLYPQVIVNIGHASEKMVRNRKNFNSGSGEEIDAELGINLVWVDHHNIKFLEDRETVRVRRTLKRRGRRY